MHVGIFSLGMSKPEVMKRMISSESEVVAHGIQSGYLNKDDWIRIGQTTAAISEAPIYIDDSANLTLLQVRSKAQRLALEHGIDLLVVDYLQLVSGSTRRYENRTQGGYGDKPRAEEPLEGAGHPGDRRLAAEPRGREAVRRTPAATQRPA
jgi:replicative DNA helicase